MLGKRSAMQSYRSDIGVSRMDSSEHVGGRNMHIAGAVVASSVNPRAAFRGSNVSSVTTLAPEQDRALETIYRSHSTGSRPEPTVSMFSLRAAKDTAVSKSKRPVLKGTFSKESHWRCEVNSCSGDTRTERYWTWATHLQKGASISYSDMTL